MSHLTVCFRLRYHIRMTESGPATPVPAGVKTVSKTPTAAGSPLRSKDVLLPLARVRTIMKSSPDVENIGQESLFLITKATELFIMYLTKLSQRCGNDQEVNLCYIYILHLSFNHSGELL